MALCGCPASEASEEIIMFPVLCLPVRGSKMGRFFQYRQVAKKGLKCSAGQCTNALQESAARRITSCHQLYLPLALAELLSLLLNTNSPCEFRLFLSSSIIEYPCLCRTEVTLSMIHGPAQLTNS